MFIKLHLLVVIISLLLQGCIHNELIENGSFKKTNLSKAASYNVQLGLGYLKQGDRPRAKKKLISALEQEPSSADVNSAMAYFFEQTKELNRAEKYYLKAILLGERAGAQLNNYGAFLCRMGDYNKAEKYFIEAANDVKYVHTAGAYENAALCALSVPDEDKAKRYFRLALNQDPSRKASLYELLKLETKSNDFSNAFDLVQKYPKLVANDKLLLSFAKKIANKVGSYEIAAEYEMAIKKMNPYIENSGVNDEHNNHAG